MKYETHYEVNRFRWSSITAQTPYHCHTANNCPLLRAPRFIVPNFPIYPILGSRSRSIKKEEKKLTFRPSLRARHGHECICSKSIRFTGDVNSAPPARSSPPSPWPLVVYGLVIRLTRPSPLCAGRVSHNKASLRALFSSFPRIFLSLVHIRVYLVYLYLLSICIILSGLYVFGLLDESPKWKYTQGGGEDVSWDYLFGDK